MTAPPNGYRGRGTAENPAGRFEPVEYVPDDEARHPDDPGPQTCLYKDTSQTVIAHNQSPDVGFEYSINPYRGCEHGCSYCMDGDTPILMGNGSTRALREIRIGDEIYGTQRNGWYRQYTRTRVLAHWATRKPAHRVKLSNGTCLVASGDHRFLTERGWKYVTGSDHGRRRRPHLTTNNALMGTGAFTASRVISNDYRRGYLSGMIRGDGHVGFYEYERSGRAHGNQWLFRLALKDTDALRRTASYLRAYGVGTNAFEFQAADGASAALPAIRTNARSSVEAIQRIVRWPTSDSSEWLRGFLAGIFDAEGSYNSGILRISNSDDRILGFIEKGLRRFGFAYVYDVSHRSSNLTVRTIRLRGGLREHLKFFQLTSSAIARKKNIDSRALKSSADLRVTRIEQLSEVRTLYDITTGTGDFIANGVVSHNCYARPFHEYLGFSAGLDFETKILVKHEAPALLRKELMKTTWTPRVIALSGVTDPYQPAERRLRITRGCLEVLAEFMNPLTIVTKSQLVTRDVDLLEPLAARDAAVVNMSITTLDRKLQRAMEPRAPTPARRLEAVRKLADAGVPVRVMVAPIVPGLTDHEMPAILEAAADAGARHASFVMLRLPHGVKDLFTNWLERHFPDRRDKVLNRVREMRGGKLNQAGFGARMRGEGVYADQIKGLFEAARRRAGLSRDRMPELSTAEFRRPGEVKQLGLFGRE